MDCSPARSRRARVARRPGLAASAVLLGLAAHLVAGVGTDWSCAPLIGAGLAGVLATLAADRFAGYRSRPVGSAVLLLGGGQFAMHLALSGALSGHAGGESVGLGLTCDVVAAHAAVTVVLTVLLLGAQRTLGAIGAVLARARAWMYRQVGRLRLPAPVRLGRAPMVLARPVVRPSVFGAVRPRRGPPAQLV